MKIKDIKKIKRQIRLNIKRRNEPHKFSKKNSFVYHTILFPNYFDITNKKYRNFICDAVNMISKTNSKTRPYFDFSKVKTLTPMATIYFLQYLHKYNKTACRGRHPDNKVVSGMLSKLGISKRLRLKETISTHDMVEKWYFFCGENTDLGDEYDQIEQVLLEKFNNDPKTFDVINTAIGEAIINVVNHAYDENEKYKYWYLFLSITDQDCSVVISDLGKTIPKSILTKFNDAILNKIFNFKNWLVVDDETKIEIATQYSRTSTQLAHRGKGFTDMKAVCDQVDGAIMSVHSRNGYWSKQENRRKSSYVDNKNQRKRNYSSPIHGTIISWRIPLTNSCLQLSKPIQTLEMSQ